MAMADGIERQDLTLFHAPQSRACIARWMLEEVGTDYNVHVLDLKNGEHLQEAYRRINPKGKVPALRHGDAIITEVAAICCYLADAFPEAGLAPSVGDKKRGAYLSWLFFGPSCIEPAVLQKTFGWEGGNPGTLGWGNYDRMLEALSEGLGAASPWLLGEQFSAADVVIGGQVRFGLAFGTLPKEPSLIEYAARVSERAALKRQLEKDEALLSNT